MRVALVTGVTGGLGLAVAAGLKQDGWTVAGADLPGSGAEFAADLSAPTESAALVDAVINRYARLDLLVNNAAYLYHGALRVDDLTRWWHTIAVNMSAPFRLARAAAPHLSRVQGQILNVASSNGYFAEAEFSAYCASKSGLVGLNKALALELAPHVRVNAVAPGAMDTPQQEIDAAAAGLTREQLYDKIRQDIPLGRILDPADVAELIIFLINATGFTGTCVHLNGGALLI